MRIIRQILYKPAVAHRLYVSTVFITLSLVVVGVCALATETAQLTDRLASATEAPKTPVTSSTIASKPEVAHTKMAEATLLPESGAGNMAGTGAAASSQRSAPVCNTALRYAAKRSYQAATVAATSRHRQALWSIQSTGMLTRYLSPSMYSYRITQEESRYQSALQHIKHAYSAALVRAHCR